MAPIERAARALAKRDYPDQSDTWHDKVWHEWVDEARAVIEALREPSDAMLDACGTGYCRKWAPAAWEQMIGVLLDDTPA